MGTRFLAEIREQPAALRRLLEHDAEIADVASVVRERDLRLVRFVGHGSSDNAASFGVYAFGLLPRWTAMRDSITLTVHYGTPLDMSGSTVIGLSQSGRTPDVVEYLRGARATGAFTIAVTNDVTSDLARAADAVIPLAAEPEIAVAATKTYVNTLNVSNKLSELGIEESLFPAIIAGALKDHTHKTNPREASPEDYQAMLSRSY